MGPDSTRHAVKDIEMYLNTNTLEAYKYNYKYLSGLRWFPPNLG